ncbi:MAG TPA: serine/threonine protein phosphatase, partial [Pseudonocardia sp.]
TATLPPGPLLLTTDGVHKTLGRDEIEAALRDAEQDPVEALLAAARRAGSRDNAAAALVRDTW